MAYVFLCYQYVSFRECNKIKKHLLTLKCGPFPATATTLDYYTFLASGNPYKPSVPNVTRRGPHPTITVICWNYILCRTPVFYSNTCFKWVGCMHWRKSAGLTTWWDLWSWPLVVWATWYVVMFDMSNGQITNGQITYVQLAKCDVHFSNQCKVEKNATHGLLQ